VLPDEERVFGQGCGLLAPTLKRTISYVAREYLSNSEVLGNLGAKILQPGKYMGG